MHTGRAPAKKTCRCKAQPGPVAPLEAPTTIHIKGETTMKKNHNEDRANYIKAGIVLLLVIIACSVSGCGGNRTSDDVIKSEEPTVIADEFECVYVQTKVGTNHFAIYRHVPTDQMYVCYVTYSLVPMNITYDEYVEKARAFHKANDTVVTTGAETDDDTQ